MSRAIDLTGKRFGRLVVIKRASDYRRWECKCDCGNTVTPLKHHLISGNISSCGCFRKEFASKRRREEKGPRAHRWSGGRRRNYAGYILVYSPGHPATDKNNCIMEHRLVMERVIGRLLKLKEVVHHIDENPANNDPSNLRLFANNIAHLAHHRVTQNA